MATILVVDDRPIDRDYLTTLFRYAGHRTIEASDGVEALAMLATERPDVIVTDVLMPRMDGFEFVRALRELPAFARTPLLFYSAAYHETEVRALAAQCGAADVLIKPSEPAQLLERLAAALERRPATAGVAPPSPSTKHGAPGGDRHQDESEPEIGERRLAALLTLGQHFTGERDPGALLQEICHAAREMTLARYATIGTLADDDERIDLLLSSGLDADVVAALRASPQFGDEIQQLLFTRLSRRTMNPSGDPAALGLPPSHPPVRTFLIVPLASPRHIYGWLATAEKLGAAEFSAADEQLIRLLGGQAGIAYENASLIRELTNRAERLRVEEERIDFALAAARLGVWEHDWVLGQTFFSRSAARLFGLGDHAITSPGDPLADRTHPDDQVSLREAVDAALQRGGEFSAEFRVAGDDGGWRWFQSRGRTDFDEAGAPIRLHGVVIDVTERRLLELQLRQAQKMEAIGQLAGGVAHDFNNLLTAILGYGRFLLEELEDPQHRLDVEQIVKAGERAAVLTKQLLAFSRRQVGETTVLDLNAIIEDMAAMLTRMIGEHIVLTTRLQPDLPNVRADRGYIEQVIMNLVVNARDAMSDGGEIRLETAEAAAVPEGAAASPGPEEPPPAHVIDGFVRLTVSDTGIGMSDEIKARLFEPFFTTKGRTKGTGLGLATVYGIVTQAGGRIVVRSAPGQGSTFDVYLPRTNEPRHASEVDGAPVAPRGHGRVLVVEDEQAVREFAVIILQRAGFTVWAAANPDEAVAVFEAQQERIDLLATDVVMPGGTGPELFERLVARQPSLRVVLMSGYSDVVPRDSGIAEWAFVQKPFTAEGLLQKVREALER